jgi:hypothetical protein
MHGSFTVTPQLDDDTERNPENVVFTLGSGNNYTLGGQNVFTFTILDAKKNTNLTEMFLSVWPNPTSGIVNIMTEMQNETLEATLYSPGGEVVYSGRGTAADLSRQLSNALQNRRVGLYHLQMVVGDEVTSTRILNFNFSGYLLKSPGPNAGAFCFIGFYLTICLCCKLILIYSFIMA